MKLNVEQILRLGLQWEEEEIPLPPPMKQIRYLLEEHAKKAEIDSVRKEDAVLSTILKIIINVFGHFDEPKAFVYGLVPRLEPVPVMLGAGGGIGNQRGEQGINLRGEACYIDLYTKGVCVVSTEEQPSSVKFINRAGEVEEITAQERKVFKRKWNEWQIPLSGEAGYLDDKDQNTIYIMEVQENGKPD